MKVVGKKTQQVCRILVKTYLKLFYKYEIKNFDKFCKTGPALVCGNHISAMDMFFIGVRYEGLIRWMAKDSLFKFKPLGRLVYLFGGYPINGEKGKSKAADTAIQLLKSNEVVGMFPEGHRKKTSDKVGYKIHAGAGMIAVETGVSIYPVAVTGGEKLFDKVTIDFGEPFAYIKEPGKDYTYDDYLSVSEDIMNRIYRLKGRK